MRFSIIVPVYNTVEYLEMCILSVINQSFSDWEMIMVDDGSDDGSRNILESYSEKDDRIRVYHQKNSGQFFARQKGIDLAQGEYILFLDSDDRYMPEALMTIDKYIQYECPDMILYTGEIVENGVATNRFIGRISAEEQRLSSQWLKESLISSNDMNSLYLKAFKRKLFFGDQTDYSSFKGTCCGEDKARLLYPLTVAKYIYYIPDRLYLYYHRDKSTMRQFEVHTISRMMANDLFRLLNDYMKLWGMDDDHYCEMVSVYYLKNYLSVYFNLRKTCRSLAERREIQKYEWKKQLDKKMFRYCFSNRLDLKDKIKLLIAVLRL